MSRLKECINNDIKYDAEYYEYLQYGEKEKQDNLNYLHSLLDNTVLSIKLKEYIKGLITSYTTQYEINFIISKLQDYQRCNINSGYYYSQTDIAKKLKNEIGSCFR